MDCVKQRHTFNLMKILITICLLTLGVQCVSSAENGLCPRLPVCCSFIGTTPWTASYHFNLAELYNELSRCEIISYGKYYFDLNNSSGLYMFNEDKETLRLIVDSGKRVYLCISFIEEDYWKYFFRDLDEERVNLKIDTLIKFLKDYNITGIILEKINIYFDSWENVNDQIIALTNKMKNKMEKLQVGLKVDGRETVMFINLNVFNYTATNVVLDNYFVEMTILNECSPTTQYESVNPIQSNEGLHTLQELCNRINASGIDMCKSYVKLQVPAVESLSDSENNNDTDILQSYSKICSDYTHGLNVKRWCLDSLFMLYDQVVFVRDYFSGLTLSMIEGDDFNRSCNCTKYPVTNSMISGWYWEENTQPEKCDLIDEIDLKNMN